VLLEALAVLDGLPDEAFDPTTAAGVHTVTEALRLAFADREAWYGDRSPVAAAELLDPAYVDARRALLGEQATYDLRPGSPGGREPRLPTHLTGSSAADAGAGLGEPTVQWGDTCHLDVADRWGNIIASTPSGGWLQSSPTIPELGFCLGTRLQMCWLDEGLPATLTPGLRPRTTLSPTLVLRDGVPVLACGTPGGDQQDQWQLPFLLHHLVFGRDLQESIEAPSFHTTSVPSSFYPRETSPGELVVEERVGAEVLTALAARGHRLVRAGDWTLGRLCAVARDPATRILSAAATSRGGQCYAVGR
jgi:gamma-glutamyltranspeptidase/glutathione hydrolase